MGSESASASHDDRISDDDEEYEGPGGGNRLLGFMFGNVDNSGELEVDYLDEVGLANILEEIVEYLKARREVSYLFQKPVSKKEAPDYLDIIQDPMDLCTIKEKVRCLEYKNRDEFRHDVWQIAFNAHLYNDGKNIGIPPLADQLLEICDYLIQDREDQFDEVEASIRDT